MSDVIVPGTPSGVISAPRTPAPSKPLRRRRPSGAPPPLPHHLHTTGKWWLITLAAFAVATFAVFHDGLNGPAVAATVADDNIVRWISEVDIAGLDRVAHILNG